MKILIITDNVGKTAPGIVFERLIQGLSSSHEIDVLTSNYDPSLDLSKVSTVTLFKKASVHPRISKFLITWFGVDFFDVFWAFNTRLKMKSKRVSQYDLVFSFVSFNHYIALIAGIKICKIYNKKLAVYTVDALPAPLGWLDYDSYYKGLQKMVYDNFSKADAFFSSNTQMLEYQLKTFLPKKKLLTGVIYNPSFGEFIHLPRINENVNIFVYTGGIYGLRKPEYLLKGFEKLLNEFPESKLVFVGTQKASLLLNELLPETLSKIEIIPFQKDLSYYYNVATALIDLDADIEDDVFLSSKITNYLMMNRIIISETGSNSPSRNLFKDIESIIQCDHDSEQVCEAMKKSILIKDIVNYKDRDVVVQMFSLGNVINKLNENFERIIS